LTDSQLPGKTVADYMDCVYDQISRLYANGGRYFVIMNLAPLDLLPQYASPEDGGLAATQYFPTKLGMNATAINGRMHATVAALNQVYAYRTPYETTFNTTWEDINVASFDVNRLMTDIYYNPTKYLNGTAPANVQGVVNLCDAQTSSNCTKQASPDSFEWFDPLHPSEQTGRVIAREFVNVIGGNSTYAMYWG
jgi:phospholipase/lecithinase/hemolysin